MIPVLMIDRGGRLDLVATRLLGHGGVPVHLLLTRGATTASRSRWCRATHKVPSHHVADEEAQVDAIVDVCSRLADRHGERPVMLFTWERYMLLAARHRERLDPVVRLDLSPAAALDLTIDKRRFAERAEAAGLPVPRSIVVASEHDLDATLALELPVFIKPPTNMSWGDLPKRLGITEKGTRVDDRGRLEQLLRAFTAEQRAVIVQESMEGPDYGHASVHSYRHPETGEVLAVCTSRRARVYPAGAGLSCFVVSEPLDDLIAPSIRAAETMGLVGTSSVQWKQDARRGWRILEIGPRIGLSMGVGQVAGVNIPLVAYRALLGHPVPRPTQRYGASWIDLGHDFVSFRTYRETREWNVASWLWSMRSVRACAFFDPRDPKPWLHQLRHHGTY